MTRRGIIRAIVSTSAAVPFLLASGSPAFADPIFTPIFAAIVASIGITGTAAAVTTAVLSGLAVAALGIGLSLLLAPSAPKPPKPENGIQVIQQPVPARIYGYGRFRVAGAMMLCEEYAGALYYVAAITGHRIHQFVGFYLNDDRITFVGGIIPSGSSGPLISDGGSAGGTYDGRYGGNITIDVREGLDPETAYPKLVTLIPTIWSSSHRGDGCSSLMMICAAVGAQGFTTTYPYGRPSPSVILDAYLVYDPRDGGQDPNNPATWLFSDNPVLCVMHFRCFSDFGPKKSYATTILPVVSSWIEEANLCDVLVALKSGGTEKRYRLGGWTTTEHDDRSTLKTMLDACDGWHVVRGDGTEIIKVGHFRTPTITITDADIKGFFIQSEIPDEESANSFKATYTSPDNDYTTVETDTTQWTADQTARGKINPATVELTWTQSTGQASRLLKRAVQRAKQPTRGRLDLKLSGLNATYERWITVNSNTVPRLGNVTIENRRPVISLGTGTVTLEFVLTDATIDDYDAATEQSADPPVPQRPNSVGPPIPSNVGVVPFLSSDGTNYTIALDVSFDSPLASSGSATYDSSFNYVVHWRVHDTGGGVAGPWTEQLFTGLTLTTARTILRTGVVLINSNLDVEICSIGTGGRRSAFSTTVNVSTAVDTVAPGSPTLTVTGTASAFLSSANTTSTNLVNVQFYRSAHGAAFGTAVAVGAPQAATHGGTTTYTDNPSTGTYDYWAVSLNGSGVASAPDGPRAITLVDAMGAGSFDILGAGGGDLLGIGT